MITIRNFYSGEAILNLPVTDLRNRVIENVSLSGADFSNDDLTGVQFRETNLIGAHFNNANLVNAKFIRCKINFAEFRNAIMHKCLIEDSVLYMVNMDNADLRLSSLYLNQIIETSFEKAKLSWMKIADSFILKSMDAQQMEKTECINTCFCDTNYDLVNVIANNMDSLMRCAEVNFADLVEEALPNAINNSLYIDSIPTLELYSLDSEKINQADKIQSVKNWFRNYIQLIWTYYAMRNKEYVNCINNNKVIQSIFQVYADDSIPDQCKVTKRLICAVGFIAKYMSELIDDSLNKMNT